MPLPIQSVPVFISSTWVDLQPERVAVKEAVLHMRETQFVGMEYFGSRDETSRQAALDEVDRSRVYVGIFAARYGSGITEAEYRRARQNGLPCFIYFKDDATIPDDLRETEPEQIARLNKLKQELLAQHVITIGFSNPHELARKVTADLHNWLFQEYLTPILERAARGELPSAQAQALLSGVKDKSALSPALLAELTALHQLRAPVGDFVGREKEIAELLTTLRGGKSASITGISGMGGIGKTELAYYVANLLRDAYPDAQLVLDMRGTDERPRDPADALASCIRAFYGPEQRLPDDTETLTHLYRSTLEGRRALILLDNASDSAQVRPLLPPEGSALLVTSRNAITLPRIQRVMLEQLEPPEARELLRGIVMRGNTSRIPEDIADRICFLCGYLPLAVRAAGSLLDVTADLDPEEYASQLEDERRRLELIGAEGVDISVEASFGLSYARLTPDAALVFRRLAVFPATFDAAAEEDVCEDAGHKHLSELLRRNLVIYNADTRRYRLHDLARLFADSRLSDEERSAGRMRHAVQYLRVLSECDELYERGGEAIKDGLARFDAERRNVEAGQEWVCQHYAGDETAARLCNLYPGVGAYVLNLRQHPRNERIIWLEAALAAARRLNDRTAEGVHLGNLGLAYADLGEMRRAVEFYEQHLNIARETSNRHGEGQALGNLGVAYARLGEARRAVEFQEQRLEIAREVGDRRGEGNALSNLGATYATLGETQRAIEFYEQALVIDRETGDRQGESYALGNLGYAYLTLGKTSQALELFNEVLTVARESGDRYSEGNSLYAMSQAFNKLGERARAITHAEAALEIFEQLESPYAEGVRAVLAQWRGEA
jgi:tetratricopeptide (TPR) repeat protein